MKLIVNRGNVMDDLTHKKSKDREEKTKTKKKKLKKNNHKKATKTEEYLFEQIRERRRKNEISRNGEMNQREEKKNNK